MRGPTVSNVEMTAGQQLEQAAMLIERALQQLDHNGMPCVTCQRMTWRNRRDAKTVEAVGGMPQRLRAAATILKTDHNVDPTPGFVDSSLKMRGTR